MAAKRKSPAQAKAARTPSRKPRPEPELEFGPGGRGGDEAPPKGEKLYYRIGEVAKITGIKPYVLRYWESEFRWMAPQKSRSKQRLYRRKDIDTILLIKKLLYEERYTIAGARKLLREMGVGKAAETVEAKTLDHRAEYRRIRQELQAIRSLL
jgi:DNA-binding transcriptional MerR regulator